MDLFAAARHYRANFQSKAREELDSFRQEPTLAAAVRRGALAMTPNERRYDHQRRLKRKDLERASEVLSAHLAEIGEATDFARLYAICEKALRPLNGLGELYLYCARRPIVIGKIGAS